MNPTVVKILEKCKESPEFFIENFCTVEHPTAGVMPFKLFSYQLDVLRDYRENRFNIFKKCRQCGISTLTGAYALWTAMFSTNKKILVVSKTDEDAKEFLKKNVKGVFDRLPQFLKDIFHDETCTYNAHEISFRSKSTIKSHTSNPETLRSSSAKLVIIDEAAFMQHMEDMWAGGQQCVSFGTLLSTSDGLIDIGDIVNKSRIKNFTKGDLNVCTDIGFENSNASWYNGLSEAIHIRTYLGYEISATSDHRLRVIDQNGEYTWRYMKDMKFGDAICMKMDTCSGSNDVIDENLAEIIGYYIGDGTAYKSRPKRLILSTDPKDVDLRIKLIEKLKSIDVNAYEQKGNGTIDVRLNNAKFVDHLNEIGLLSKDNSRNASIPKLILRSGRLVIAAFLRGLFEADGYCANSEYKKVGFSTSSSKLVDEVRTALLSLGIITNTHVRQSDNRFSKDIYYELFIADSANLLRFRNEVGFLSDRKNDLLNNVKSTNSKPIKHNVVREFAKKARSYYKSRTLEYNRLTYYIKNGSIPYETAVELCDKHDLEETKLGFLVSNNIYIDMIEDIKQVTVHTGDISVPETSTYIANGFISHNTLMHGGSCIVISTCKGVGNWYWATWMDAVAEESVFNPIQINWWDMNWTIEYESDTGEIVQISPRKDIRRTKSEEEKDRYGPWWSPWLEEQYKALQRRGEGHLFKQEVLAEFLGSGNTVVDPSVLRYIGENQEEVKKSKYTLSTVDYEDPTTGESRYIDFDKHLWIWEKPVHHTDRTKGHSYVMGVDVSGGDNKDYSAIEIFDIDTQEQVAELNIRVNVAELKYMIDYLGRWYNTALVAVDKTGIGETLAKDLENEICYPSLWRSKKKPKDKGQVGLAISTGSKPKLNGALRENLGVDGFVIHSSRLYKQLTIYVNFGNGKTGNEPGPGNSDDCVLATALAFFALGDIHAFSGDALAPFRAGSQSYGDVPTDIGEAHARFGNAMAMMPFSGLGFEDETDMKIVYKDELTKFASQIGGFNRKKGESVDDQRLRLREDVNKKPASKKIVKQITLTKPESVAKSKKQENLGFSSQKIVSNKKNR